MELEIKENISYFINVWLLSKLPPKFRLPQLLYCPPLLQRHYQQSELSAKSENKKDSDEY